MTLSHLSSRLVLLLSADPLIANLLRVTLESGGYQVTHEPTLAGIRAALTRGTVSALLLVCEPAGSGCLQSCQLLASATPAPIIVIGHAASRELRIQARRAGAADYVVWPVDPVELLARVEALLRLVAHVTGRTARREIAPGLVLDVERQVVSVQGEEQAFSAVEFKLLCYLAAHPGRVFTRDQLLDAVWGWERAVNAREVDVYISYLRHKIEENPRAPRYLRTVRGTGYQFERRQTR